MCAPLDTRTYERQCQTWASPPSRGASPPWCPQPTHSSRGSCGRRPRSRQPGRQPSLLRSCSGEFSGLAGDAMRLILTCYLSENQTSKNIPSYKPAAGSARSSHRARSGLRTLDGEDRASKIPRPRGWDVRSLPAGINRSDLAGASKRLLYNNIRKLAVPLYLV